MHADRGVDEMGTGGQPQAGFQVGRTVARADGHHALHAGGARALDHRVAVGVELEHRPGGTCESTSLT
jgi:hypothetical protein